MMPSNHLTMNQYLKPGDSLVSNNGRFNLILQGDGNLILNRVGQPGSAMWLTSTAGHANIYWAYMQDDGNFVVRVDGVDGKSIWASKTPGNPGAALVLTDTGDLVIQRPNGNIIWTSESSSKLLPNLYLLKD